MPDKTWKKVERRVAKMFGTERNPLSGRNSRHTMADVIHDSLYIEVKHRSRIPFYRVWLDVVEKAKQEGKAPVLILHSKGSDKYIAMVDAEYLARLVHE
ncbi:MAG: hypothetical protein ACP5GS_08465 [Nitrososphaeria archaeon]